MSSPLILPQAAQPPLKPGMNLEVLSDGPQVGIRLVSTIVLDPQQARQLLHVLSQSIIDAEAFGQAITLSINGSQSSQKPELVLK